MLTLKKQNWCKWRQIYFEAFFFFLNLVKIFGFYEILSWVLIILQKNVSFNFDLLIPFCITKMKEKEWQPSRKFKKNKQTTAKQTIFKIRNLRQENEGKAREEEKILKKEGVLGFL